MADVTITVSIVASKGGASVSSIGATGAASASFTMTGTDLGSGTATADPTPATLSVGSATGPYWLFVRNNGAAGEDIRIGNASANPITSLRTTITAGESNLISVETGGTVYFESETGTPQLYWVAVEK